MSEKTGWLDLELEAYYDKNNCPMHMPGHKRKSQIDFKYPPFSYDITEINGFDNLHKPEGIIKTLEEKIAALYKVRSAILTVGGSTSGILSTICAAAGPRQGIIIARNCHTSVYHAALVQGLETEYILPAPDGSVSSDSVREAIFRFLKRKISPAAVVITCPTYEGVMSDIAAIAETVHSFGARLIVDAAHGAHLLGFEEDFFPKNPIQSGADAAVISFHKTLPALTMTAGILINDLSLLPGIREQLDIFETSSPSYLLMASVSKMVRLIEDRGKELFRSYRQNLEQFYGIVRQFKAPSILSYEGRDPGKIVIVSDKDITKSLRDRFGIEVEMAARGYCLAMTSISDGEEDFGRLSDALRELNKGIIDSDKPSYSETETNKPVFFRIKTLPSVAYDIRTAYYSDKEEIPAEEAKGRIAAKFIFDFPPEIPFYVPGEIIDETGLFSARSVKVIKEA